MYGAQDEKFDKSQKLHSLATEFGAKKAFRISKFFHVVCVLCFVLVGVSLKLGLLYYVGVLIAAITLVYQHSIVGPKDFHMVDQSYFMRNGIVSVAILIFTFLSL